MRFIRYQRGAEISYGLQEEDGIVKQIDGNIFSAFRVTSETIPHDDIRVLPPVLPGKIIAVGHNYKDHIKEMGAEVPDEPVIFMKPSTSVIGDEDTIVYPPSSERVDYEAELAVVIKDIVKDVSVTSALDHILGYTCMNDVTARDLQRKDGQWTRGKGFDTFAPLGPCIVTDIDTVKGLDIQLLHNGIMKQNSNTANLLFDVPHLISFISGVMTLLPGDVISTGTPSGIGPMQPGDTVSVRIEGIGTLTNRVVSEPDVA
jgi:2-keto-4-pentenoate hydratase/2-oxohepta-3-ene-1,7-dioic acid hydratase in catechol pathway